MRLSFLDLRLWFYSSLTALRVRDTFIALTLLHAALRIVETLSIVVAAATVASAPEFRLQPAREIIVQRRVWSKSLTVRRSQMNFRRGWGAACRFRRAQDFRFLRRRLRSPSAHFAGFSPILCDYFYSSAANTLFVCTPFCLAKQSDDYIVIENGVHCTRACTRPAVAAFDK